LYENYHYAVNIFDLTRDDKKYLGPILIAPVVPNKIEVKVGKNVDELALLLECDAQRAAAICLVIRMKWPKHLIRCYQSKTGKGGWKKI